MPELPEVEHMVRSIRAAGLVGRRICGVSILWPRSIQGMAASAFARVLTGRRLTGVSRRAKWIRFDLDNGAAVFAHPRMSGHFHPGQREQAPRPHDRVILNFENDRQLHFHDPRKFGRWAYARQPDEFLAGLGPEPMDRRLTPARFHAALQARSRRLKPLLLDQTFLAGVGNIYADEALWLAGLDPRRRSDSLAAAGARKLLAAVRSVLRAGIRHGGTSLGAGTSNYRRLDGSHGRHQDYLKVYRRTGQPCRRCGKPVVQLVVGQRSTHICPACQK